MSLDHRDVSTAGLPSTWVGEDEWYNLVPAPSGVRFLATVDDSTLAQGQRGYYGDPGMGPFHPVTWCQYYDGGRAWLTTLGHDAGDWETGSSFLARRASSTWCSADRKRYGHEALLPVTARGVPDDVLLPGRGSGPAGGGR